MKYAITPDAKNGTGVSGWNESSAKDIKLGMNADAQDVKLAFLNVQEKPLKKYNFLRLFFIVKKAHYNLQIIVGFPFAFY